MKSNLVQRITDGEVWVFRYQKEIAVFSIFSRKEKTIELLANLSKCCKRRCRYIDITGSEE